MLIIKGNVQTGDGPVAVEKLQEGDLLVDRGHRARRLLKIERQAADRTLGFVRNKGAVLSADAVLLTAYGERSATAEAGVKLIKNNSVSMALSNSRVVQDKTVVREEAAEGYKLTVEDGENIFVNDYCVRL